MLERSKSPMNSLLAKVPSRSVSRAASVNSSAARCPLDILEVSIRSRGSSGLCSVGGCLVAIILASLFVKFVSTFRHAFQQGARSKMGCPSIREFLHCNDYFLDA